MTPVTARPEQHSFHLLCRSGTKETFAIVFSLILSPHDINRCIDSIRLCRLRLGRCPFSIDQFVTVNCSWSLDSLSFVLTFGKFRNAFPLSRIVLELLRDLVYLRSLCLWVYCSNLPVSCFLIGIHFLGIVVPMGAISPLSVLAVALTAVSRDVSGGASNSPGCTPYPFRAVFLRPGSLYSMQYSLYIRVELSAQ